MHLSTENAREPKHVVIVGGGFAGLKCAVDLAGHRGVRITLIDRNNYQQFNPLLYQVAAGLLSPSNAAFALRDVLHDHKNVDVQMAEVASIDLNSRTAHTVNGNSYAGDFLVVAAGAHVNFYGTPGAEEHTFPLYSLENAEKLRSAILSAFERADSDPHTPADGALNFVVVGGGTTGVEMAGTIGDLVHRMLDREFRHIRPSMAQVYLVERSPTVLGSFSPASQSYAIEALKKHGVELHLDVAVKEVTADGVLLANGVQIPSKTVVWAAGLKANALKITPELVLGPGGRIPIEKDLSVAGFPGVYVLGDLANATDANDEPLPQLAAVAKQAGQHCARNISDALDAKPPRPFVYEDRGVLAMIGRNAAVAELGRGHHELVGPIAFAAWLGVHAGLLTVNRARLEAVVEWSWNYFLGEHPGQIINQ